MKPFGVEDRTCRRTSVTWIVCIAACAVPSYAGSAWASDGSGASQEPVATFPEQGGTTSPAAAFTTPAPVTPAPVTPAPVTPEPRVEPAQGTRPSVDAPVTTAEAPVRTEKAATDRPSHQGFYFRGGTGPTFLTLRGDGPDGHAKVTGLGSAMNVAIGGGITEWLALAGTLQATQAQGAFRGGPYRNARLVADGVDVKASDQAMAAVASLGVLLDVYPKPTQNWHFGTSLTVGMMSVTNLADGSSYYGSGFGTSLFVGYDWHLIRNWAIGLGLFGSTTTRAKFKDAEDQTTTGYELQSFSLGLSSSILNF